MSKCAPSSAAPAAASGQITIHGVPLADLDPVLWRQRLAVIFQDFADTS